MKRIALVLSFVLVICSFFMVGCGDKYKNFKLVLDKEEVTLEISDDASKNFVEVTATVKGAQKGVSTDVIFTSLTEGLVLEVSEKEKNSTKCTIYIQDYVTNQVAQVKVTTKEANKSKLLTINLIRKITSVSVNANYKPAVAINSSLLLDASEALVLEPQNTTQRNFKFSLEDNYESVTLTENGELTVGNIIPASGYITIKATNIDALDFSTTFNVYVVEALTLTEQVTAFIDAKTTLEVALNQKSNVELSFTNTLNEDEYYTYYITEVDNDNNIVTSNNAIFQIENTLSTNKFNLTATKLGNAKFQVIAGVTGYDKKYASFTFYIEIKVKNIPTLLSISRVNRVSGLSTVVPQGS